MNILEKLLFFVGILLVGWGLLFVAGSILGMLNPTSPHSLATYGIAMTLLGIVPGVGGVVLCWKMRRQSRRRQSEARERTMLLLAKENEGKLTVAQVAMSMSVSSTEAKEMLDRCHLDGLATIQASDSGSVEYLFSLR